MKYTLCILLLMCGCKSEPPTENAKADVQDTTSEAVTEIYEPVDEQESDVTSKGTFQLENDDIGGYPFEHDFNTLLMSLGDAEITKKPVRNIHDSTRTDTLVRVNFGRSTIEYYKVQADGSSLILEASIQSNQVSFKKGIRIGMSSNDFIALFEELQGMDDLNTVIISTMEGLNQSVFLFENQKLSNVRYESYFD